MIPGETLINVKGIQADAKPDIDSDICLLQEGVPIEVPAPIERVVLAGRGMGRIVGATGITPRASGGFDMTPAGLDQVLPRVSDKSRRIAECVIATVQLTDGQSIPLPEDVELVDVPAMETAA